MDCRIPRKFADRMYLSSKSTTPALRKAALPGFRAKNHVHQRCPDKRLLLPSIFDCEKSGKTNWSRLCMSWISLLWIYRLDGEPNVATVLLKDGYFFETIAPDLEQISMGSGP